MPLELLYHTTRHDRVTVDALLAVWRALAGAELALEHPFHRPAFLAIDGALVALAELEERLGSTTSHDHDAAEQCRRARWRFA